MLRSYNEIIETALANSIAYIPAYILEREQEKKLKKYSYKKNLKSRRKKGC